MRKAEYSVEEILAAGAALLESGSEVNGWKLRSKLGGGNTRRLYSVWCEHNSPGQDAAPAPLPEELAKAVDGIAETVGSQLRALLASTYSEMAEQSSKRINEAHMLVEAVRQSASLDAEEASFELDRLETRIEELETADRKLTENLDQVKSELQSALVELAHFKERSSSLEGQLSQLQVDHSRLQADHAVLLQQNQQQALQISASAQRVSDLQSFLELQTAELNDARRHEQAARERETIASTQASTIERLRNEDAAILQRLRLDLSTAQKDLAKSETMREMVSIQLAESEALVEKLRAGIGDHPGGLGAVEHSE